MGLLKDGNLRKVVLEKARSRSATAGAVAVTGATASARPTTSYLIEQGSNSSSSNGS